VPIKLIAMDIDGTLLDSKSQIPAENLKAITEAASRGIEIVLVTGRRFDFALPIAQSIPCELHLIVNNGALAKSLDGFTHLRSLLPRETALQVLESTKEFRSCATVVFDRTEGPRVILEKVDFDDPFRGSYFRRNRDHIGECTPLTDCLNGDNSLEDPIQLAYVGNCQPMRAAMQRLESLTAKHGFALALTEYEQRNLSILDVVQGGVSKGATLQAWARLRSINRENIMAIGDNWNDSEMLEFAGTPVVMGNSVADLKLRGWPITASNDQCGVADAIRTYALNAAREAVQWQKS
jgi:Cof subfamily protein (haloacid dehalogenase superfamily)